MNERILIDSITLGVPESEVQHAGEGDFARPSDRSAVRYGGAPGILDTDGLVCHRREFSGRIALWLHIPEPFVGMRASLSAVIRVEQGGTDDPVVWSVEMDSRPVASGEWALSPDDGWCRVETGDLGAPARGAVRLIVDAGGRAAALSSVRLLASDESVSAEAALVVVDAVDVGLRESEVRHRTLWAIAHGNPEPANAYGGASRIEPARDQSHFRETTGLNGFYLDVPPAYVGADAFVEITVRRRIYGKPANAPAPVALEALGRTRRAVLGEVSLDVDDRFRVLALPVPGRVLEPGGVMLRVDDQANFARRDAYHGLAIASIRLLCAPAGPATRARGDASDAAARPDVALVMCPVWNLAAPPVALATLASTLEAGGAEVRVFDLNIDCYHWSPVDLHPMWEGSNAMLWSDGDYGASMLGRFEPFLQSAAARILDSGAPVVGFSIASVNAAFSVRLAAILKERSPETTIVFGGPGVPFFEEGQLGPDWDYLVYGAGEEPLLSIVRDKKADLPGVVRQGSPAPYDPETNRSFIERVEDLPLLHYGRFDLTLYQKPWVLPVMTSRGCINTCRYCFDAVFYKPFSCLSGRRAFEQLRLLVERHDRRVFEFSDLLCNGDLDELRAMCELLVEADLGIRWGSFAVMRPGMTPELMALIRASGCHYLHYGFESGSQRMLRRMGRTYTIADARDSLVNTKRAGIETRINVMVGFPGENDASIDETIAFIRENARAIDLVETVNPVYIMASTDLADHRAEYGIEMADGIPDHWETGELTEARRRDWVYRVMDAIRAAGVRCSYSILRGFTCSDGTTYGET